jgi:hypothetical protein
MALGSTQRLTKMSTRNLPGGKKRPAHKADNLPAIMSRMSENVGASTSRKCMALHGLRRDKFTLPSRVSYSFPIPQEIPLLLWNPITLLTNQFYTLLP